MIYVVGSGPSGVSCAKALLDLGQKVTMLDTGLEANPELIHAIQKASKEAATNWKNNQTYSGNLYSTIKKTMIATAKDGVPQKLFFGSDHPYRPIQSHKTNEKNASITQSFAKGGLSSVWGTQILPFSQEDTHDWPITLKELEPYYKKVFKLMTLGGEKDNLETLFPLYTNPLSVKQSSQAKGLLSDLKKNKKTLEKQGVHFGSSRLALKPVQHIPETFYHGLHMYGDPTGTLYCSEHTLKTLLKHPNFTYKQGILVDRVEEKKNVTLFCTSLKNNKELTFTGKRVYLACNVLNSTAITLKSLKKNKATLQDVAYFMIPLLRYKSTKHAMQEDLHTLAQAFIEIKDQTISSKTVHLQVYTFNELYVDVIKKKLGPFYLLFKPFEKLFFTRFLLVQGFLHSDNSPTITAKLQDNNIQLIGEKRDDTKRIIKKIVKKLGKLRKYLKAIPLRPLLQVHTPGKSFHTGGSFPMKANPGEVESDTYGRPHGFKKVHIVDASIFTSIPATTITLTTMANAYRIGDTLKDYEKD